MNRIKIQYAEFPAFNGTYRQYIIRCSKCGNKMFKLCEINSTYKPFRIARIDRVVERRNMKRRQKGEFDTICHKCGHTFDSYRDRKKHNKYGFRGIYS